MIEEIEGLEICKCGGDCLPNKVYMTDAYRNSVEVLICPECGGQIETMDGEIKRNKL